MGKGLVETTFEAGPNDDLLVVDVYEQGGSEVVNSYQKKDGGAIDVLSAINGGDGGGGSSTSSPPPESSEPPPPEYSQSEINRILSDGDSDLFGLLTNLSASTAAKFGISTQTTSSIATIVNGVSAALNTSYSASDVKNVAEIANVLSDGQYATTVKDKKALDDLVTATVTTGADIGLPKVFSQIASNPAHDKDVLASAANEAIQATIEKGDTSVFLDVVSTEFVTGLETRYPAIIQDVLQSATKPSTLSEQSYSDYYTELTDGFTKINGEWNKAYVNNKRFLFTDTEVKNEFLLETLQAYVFNIPFDIAHNEDVQYNSAIDVQFGDIQIGAIFRAIYGATLDSVFITEKLNEWLDPDASILRENRRDAWFTMTALQFSDRTIEEDFKLHFPIDIPNLNREISVT